MTVFNKFARKLKLEHVDKWERALDSYMEHMSNDNASMALFVELWNSNLDGNITSYVREEVSYEETYSKYSRWPNTTITAK
jgi:hypothetical protein